MGAADVETCMTSQCSPMVQKWTQKNQGLTMQSTDEIRSAFLKWVHKNPRQAALILAKMVEDAPDWRMLGIVDVGHDLEMAGLPQIEDGDDGK